MNNELQPVNKTIIENKEDEVSEDEVEWLVDDNGNDEVRHRSCS